MLAMDMELEIRNGNRNEGAVRNAKEKKENDNFFICQTAHSGIQSSREKTWMLSGGKCFQGGEGNIEHTSYIQIIKLMKTIYHSSQQA